MKNRLKALKGYLLSDFQRNPKMHDTCASDCMTWQFGEKCFPKSDNNSDEKEAHFKDCLNCIENTAIFKDIKTSTSNLNCTNESKKELNKELGEVEEKLNA